MARALWTVLGTVPGGGQLRLDSDGTHTLSLGGAPVGDGKAGPDWLDGFVPQGGVWYRLTRQETASLPADLAGVLARDARRTLPEDLLGPSLGFLLATGLWGFVLFRTAARGSSGDTAVVLAVALLFMALTGVTPLFRVARFPSRAAAGGLPLTNEAWSRGLADVAFNAFTLFAFVAGMAASIAASADLGPGLVPGMASVGIGVVVLIAVISAGVVFGARRPVKDRLLPLLDRARPSGRTGA